jgi:hypothetical protein
MNPYIHISHPYPGILNELFLFCPEKPGPLGQVRDRWLCLGVLCLKSQIPSTKLQINLKLQITNSKPVQRTAQVLVLHERLFFCLGF